MRNRSITALVSPAERECSSPHQAGIRTGAIDWAAYETRFLGLMRERRIEETVPKEVLRDGCLLCSEDQPHHCHRRLVAEYLNERWGNVRIEHLGLAKAAPEP